MLSGYFMKMKYVFPIILIIAVMLILIFRTDDSLEPESPPVDKLLKYSWTVRNTTNRTVHDAVLKIYSPVEKTPYQVCRELTASHSFDSITDEDGNRILAFRIPELTPFSTEIIHVKVKVEMRNHPEMESLVPDKEYTAARKYIESDHPLLIKKTEELRGKNSRETAGNIHNWVAGNLRYSGYLKNERGALYALRNRTGDCTEYMDLFVAMCRAVNIPARCVGGYVVTEDRVLNPSEYHNWAQFYDGRAWQTADPQKGKFMTDQSDYIAMKIYGKRVASLDGFERFNISDSNLKVKMNQ